MRRIADQRGAARLEYGMILALIAVVLVVVVSQFGPTVSRNLSGPIIDGESVTTTVTVLGVTEERPDCVGRDHAHQGCR